MTRARGVLGAVTRQEAAADTTRTLGSGHARPPAVGRMCPGTSDPLRPDCHCGPRSDTLSPSVQRLGTLLMVRWKILCNSILHFLKRRFRCI